MKNLKEVAAKGKAILRKINLDCQEKVHVGLDVHKKTYHVAVWSSRRDTCLATWVQPASIKVTLATFEPFGAHIERIVYEAGPSGFTLARALKAAGLPAEVISPGHTPEAPVNNGKSDRLDAARLAEFSTKNLLRAINIPTETEEADRQVFRRRCQLIKNLNSIKCRIKSFLLLHGIAAPPGLERWSKKGVAALRALALVNESLAWTFASMLDELQFAQDQVNRVTTKLASLSKSEPYRERAERLRGPNGVGLLTAMAFTLELPRPERFRSQRQVSRILGLSPEIRSTGQSVHQTGRGAGGNARLRSMLIEAAWRWRAGDAMALHFYQRILANTGSSKKAIVALARKLGIVLWRLSIGTTPYCPGILNVPDNVFKGMKQKAKRRAK